MHHIITPVNDLLMYERCIHTNSHLTDTCIRKNPCNNRKRKAHISVLYNEFIDRLDPADNGWLIFCREDFEFLENPIPLLEKADKNSLYGVFGARLVKNLRGEVFHEYISERFDCIEKEGEAHVVDTPFAGGEIVDTLDCQCLMIYAATLRRHALRFDPALSFNLYVEDLCLAAGLDHGLPSRVLRVRYRRHSLAPGVGDRPSFASDLAACEAKYRGRGRKAGIHNIFNEDDGRPVTRGVLPSGQTDVRDNSDNYRRPVDGGNANHPAVLLSDMMRPRTIVLDVGCASGDNGIFLKSKLDVTLWGLERNSVALARARSTGVYEEALSFDLDNFHLRDYSRFYGFFDYILLGDVLEHIVSPLPALKKLAGLLTAGGSFLVSMPNVAHAAVIANLLEGEFEYQDTGILDATHLRFFTRKSLAALFADAGLAIEKATATFYMPDSSSWLYTPKHRYSRIWGDAPPDRHCLVVQYVSELRRREGPSADIARHNLALLDRAPENNLKGWEAKRESLDRFLEAVRLSCDKAYPEKTAETVCALWNQGRLTEAVHASRLFDEKWYLRTYPEAAREAAGLPPLLHFLSTGWRKGYNPSEHFDTAWYLATYPAAAEADACPLLHYIGQGMQEGYARNPHAAQLNDADAADYARYIITDPQRTDSADFVPCAAEPYRAEEGEPRLIAFYLPQFYPFPENDVWWGKGFTEWTNASKALPQYAGHYQPHLPLEGFYDLRLEETVKRQIELARFYGIHGFCYHYYWFSGYKLMDVPIRRLLEQPALDLPFCLCWANDPWNARWDGSNNELLMGQDPAWDAGKFFADILPLLADPRYIRVNGKPMLIIYRPTYFERKHFRNCVTRLCFLAEKHGLGGLHVVFAKTHRGPDYPPEDYGGEAFVEFPPHRVELPAVPKKICNPRFRGKILDARRLVEVYKAAPQPQALTYRTVFPMWDNTPRKAEISAWIFAHTSPEWYQDWLEYALAATRKHHAPEHNFVFINAWNEWGEGAHLEPDRRYGFAFLEATKKALYTSRGGTAEPANGQAAISGTVFRGAPCK